MSEKVRCRGTYFSGFKKELVIELVTKYMSIIECKRTDGLKLEEKDAAWEKIRNEFNSSTQVSPRSAKQLRQFYVNLKHGTKKAKCEERLERFKTGDGEFKINKVDESVYHWLRIRQIHMILMQSVMERFPSLGSKSLWKSADNNTRGM